MKTFFAIFAVTVLAATASGQFTKPPAPPAATSETAAEADEAFARFDFAALAVNPNNLTGRMIADLRENFLPEVKPFIIKKGDYPPRLKRIAAPVFELHKADKSEVVVFTHRVPMVFTWKETFIAFSTAAMDLLSDDEIAALVGHEIGHLYFAEALSKAREEKDDRAARVIELRCDLIALVTLSKFGITESSLLSAVEKLIEKRSRLKAAGFQPDSPNLENRQRVSELYTKRRKRGETTALRLPASTRRLRGRCRRARRLG